jgi:uncharacterized protein
MKRVVKLAVGWFFLVLGVIGCFLPILQGFLFMAVGLLFLADDSPWLQKHLQRLEGRYPEQMRAVHAFRNGLKYKVRGWLRRR